MPPKKRTETNAIPLAKIFDLRFVDSNGRVFVLDHGHIRGEYILREIHSSEIKAEDDDPSEV